MNRSALLKAVAAVLVLIGLAVVSETWESMIGTRPEIDYSEMLSAIDAGHVADLAILPEVDIRGVWSEAAPDGRAGTGFVVDFPTDRSESLVERAQEAGVRVTFRETSLFERVSKRLGVILVFVLYGVLIWLFGSQFMQMGSGSAQRAEKVATGFEDVGGTQGAAEELREVVDFLKHPKKYQRLGARTPRGVLMVGPSGTGKTLMARAVAGDAGVPFYFLGGSEVSGLVVGLGVVRIKRIFKQARKTGGVIFIDEIDTLAARRGGNQVHNEDDRTMNQLLVEMDGFQPTEDVVVMGATNRPDILDEAIKRPGRFDRIIHVTLPTTDGREEILRVHAGKRKMPLASDVDLRALASLTPGQSGADMENLLNEAAIAAAREDAPEVAWRHFESARDRLYLGRERKGFTPKARELRITAFHEIGHAITGILHVPEEGLHKVSIQARGQALGVAHFSPMEDQNLHGRRYLIGQMVKVMGGRAAEEIVFGPDEITSGAGHDFEQANRIARQMVTRFGMGPRTGYLVQSDVTGPLSNETQRRMDEDVQELIVDAYAVARATLESNRAVLDEASETLIEKETLDREDLEAIFVRHGGLKTLTGTRHPASAA